MSDFFQPPPPPREPRRAEPCNSLLQGRFGTKTLLSRHARFGTLVGMPPSAPRIDARLLAALARLDQGGSIADTHRRLGELASRLALPRPSYEQVRVLVHEHRRGGAAPGAGEILLDVAVRARPPEALLELLGGD